jgi:glycogen phosphorylase
MSKGTLFSLEVNPKIPSRLHRLEEIADNLWYSWHRPTRSLFSRLDRNLWRAVNNNPKEFLRRVDERNLIEASTDQVFLSSFNQIISDYDTYHNEPLRRDGSEWLLRNDLIAYFCAEFGFHESFPIYSGGLGILAGDHCKAASDMRLPFIAVGLLYRQGYFHQRIDGDGNQIAIYQDADMDKLPIKPALRADGSEVVVHIDMPGRTVFAKVWSARAGHVILYLLDTNLKDNSEADRDITHQLYGGDREMRIKQEMVLGVGGVRMLRELGVKPTAWHINEGHAAFLVIARIRKLMQEGLDYASALEAVAANTVFTTHTPVPAGHDHFTRDQLMPYLEPLSRNPMIPVEQLYSLGLVNDSQDFNMTALAIRGSRFQNGVSRIHGDVSAQICAPMWPEIQPEDNPLAYVTNGVHVPTFLAWEWTEVFDRYLGQEWRYSNDPTFWSRVEEIPDHIFWSVHQALKARMLDTLHKRIRHQQLRIHGSDAHLDRLFRHADPLDPNVLTIGFARRFASYKRATLLFDNPDWLRKIVTDTDRPVLFVFAGKAHPADKPGQDLIRHISAISRSPEFAGHVLLCEGYDLGLARRLVSGVDVWLNTPLYPLEASGTSGMKAGINGVMNFSILDGWWGEGYNSKNGWAIKPAPENWEEHRRSREEAQSLYEILEDQIVPMYYNRGKLGYSDAWVKMAKHSISSLLPQYNSTRMVGEYLSKFYLAATKQWRRFSDNQYENASKLSQWKARINQGWREVRLNRLDTPVKRVDYGDSLRFEVGLQLNGLKPEDIVVELLLGRPLIGHDLDKNKQFRFISTGTTDAGGAQIYALELKPELCGSLDYKIRAYPWHELLTHPLEMGLMVWL